jgi:hypothetical protein
VKDVIAANTAADANGDPVAANHADGVGVGVPRGRARNVKPGGTRRSRNVVASRSC